MAVDVHLPGEAAVDDPLLQLGRKFEISINWLYFDDSTGGTCCLFLAPAIVFAGTVAKACHSINLTFCHIKT